MGDTIRCYNCGNASFDYDSGFYYCNVCNCQADSIADIGNDKEFMGAVYTHKKILPTVKIEHETLISEPQLLYCKDEPLDDCEPPKPSDFVVTTTYIDPEIYSSEIRMRYVQGIQLMIQFQCEALVEKFGVNPLICGLVGVIWLRFIAVSRVFDEKWADDNMQESENSEGLSSKKRTRIQENSEKWNPRFNYRYEPFNINHRRLVLIWFRSLIKKIPVSTSLAISFLACHVAREAILPTDILTWALEGKLPYLNAFIDIGKCMKFPPKPSPTSACPLTASFMFKPSQVLGSKALESQAGSIAQQIGLQLPPVNFHAIACRYLKQLSLPVEKVLPHASRLHEWSMPRDLWLPANRDRLPTRVCVMSLLMIAIRISYNINGLGKWEESLCSSESSTTSRKEGKSSLRCKSRKSKGKTKKRSLPAEPTRKCGSSIYSRGVKGPQNRRDNIKDTEKIYPSCNLPGISTLRGLSSIQQSRFEAAHLIYKLEALHERISDVHDYRKDLKTYLSFSKEVIFTGLTPLLDDHKEEETIEKLWNFYENQEDQESEVGCTRWSSQRREQNKEYFRCNRPMNDDAKPKDNGCIWRSEYNEAKIHRLDEGDCSPSHQEEEPSLKPTTGWASVRKMKLNMEENGFLYIPPRVKLKRLDYLHYIRKNDQGSRSYVAHADYYILLRACARVAEVNVHYLHTAVLRLEKRLAWIENHIDQSLRLRP